MKRRAREPIAVEFWIKENQDAANAAVEQSQNLDQCPELCHCCQGPRVHQLKMPSEIWLDSCSNFDLLAALVSYSSGSAIWYQSANGRAPHTVELGDNETREENSDTRPYRYFLFYLSIGHHSYADTIQKTFKYHVPRFGCSTSC